jgi:hypothetical protein
MSSSSSSANRTSALKDPVSRHANLYLATLVILYIYYRNLDRLCGLVVRVPGYRSGGPGFNSRALQEKKSSGSGTGSTQPLEYN